MMGFLREEEAVAEGWEERSRFWGLMEEGRCTRIW